MLACDNCGREITHVDKAHYAEERVRVDSEHAINISVSDHSGVDICNDCLARAIASAKDAVAQLLKKALQRSHMLYPEEAPEDVMMDEEDSLNYAD